jgi:lipoprotein-anchoring transpeptidase ErfK/SrfK
MKLFIKSVLLLSSVMLAGCAMNNDSSGNYSISSNGSVMQAQAAPQPPPYQFPGMRPATGSRIVIVDPNEHAWGAYNAEGILVAQGAASTGKGYCEDLGGPCKTPSGTFAVYRKGGADCKSSIFPIPEGGAPMPYCMFFHGGYALHGSDHVPNYNASHGCVRMHPSDAAWLSNNFVKVGTKVQILPY